MRVFIGFRVCPTIYNAAMNLAKSVDYGGNRLSYVSLQNFHCTLVFLGDLTEQQLLATTKLCQNIQGLTKSFFIEYDKWQLISKFRPTILSIVPSQLSREFINLQNLLTSGLRNIKPQFQAKPPHLTVVRIKTHMPHNYALPSLAAPLIVKVDSFEIIKSELTKQGSIYTTLFTFPI